MASHLSPIQPIETAFVGDRILTDIVFGNRNGNLTIWTNKVITEDGDNKAALVVKSFLFFCIIIEQCKRGELTFLHY